MKTRTFVIHSENEIKRLNTFLEAQPKEPLLEVVVRLHKKDRSAEQNRYYWQIITILADEVGLLKEEAHDLYKRKYLVKIFERDHVGYANMINSVRKLHTQGFKQDSKALGDQIVRMTSTASASVKQFSEYLTDILRDADSNGIILPRPEDRNLIFMERK